ncbi:MAG: hypothetical protein M5U25_18835 [Planctomycetota bacterium]|nr:hypothetical protein [Planctomycetota bacterium]
MAGSTNSVPKLDVTALDKTTVMSAGLRTHLQEAAYVMLSGYHKPPTTSAKLVEGDSGSQRDAEVLWREPTDLEVSTHQNSKDATEYAAYALAAAFVHATEGFTLVGRMPQGTGADFWMLRDSDNEDDIVRVEASGIADGHLGKRLREKVDQILKGNSNLPGLAFVARFAQSHMHAERVKL